MKVMHRMQPMYTNGMGIVAIIWMIIMLLLVIGAIFVMIYMIRNNNSRQKDSTASSSNALHILKDRFARGEIDVQEYKERKEVLEQDD